MARDRFLIMATLLGMMGFHSVAKSDAGVDTSLAFKSMGDHQINQIGATNGDLYKDLLHHGPAVENEWVGYRIYFNQYLSVDLLSKFVPRLELAQSQWYTLKKKDLASQNYGTDNFKVKKTVGLGGLRLFDSTLGDKGEIVTLALADNKQAERIASVSKDKGSAYILMQNKQVNYQGSTVDIDIKLSVVAGQRYAVVQVDVADNKTVSFASGLVVHSDLKSVIKDDDMFLTWGDYDSPAADEQYDVGAAIVFDSSLIDYQVKIDDQLLFVTKPLNSFTYIITSANEKEQSDINTLQAFKQHVASLHNLL